MGRLNHLIEAQSAPREAKALAGVFVSSNDQIDKLLKSMSALGERIASVESQIAKKVDGIKFPSPPDLSEEFAALASDVRVVLQAVQAIRIPEPASVPPAPIPERVDLEPLFAKLNQIERLVDNSPVVMPAEKAGGKEWEFEIIRNNFGAIDKVIAKEI